MAVLKKIQRGAVLTYHTDKDGKKRPDIYDGGDEWILERGTPIRIKKEFSPTWFVAYLSKWATGNTQITEEGKKEYKKYDSIIDKLTPDDYGVLARKKYEYHTAFKEEMENAIGSPEEYGEMGM